MTYRIYANTEEQHQPIPLDTYGSERAAREELAELNRDLRLGNMAPEVRSFVIRKERGAGNGFAGHSGKQLTFDESNSHLAHARSHESHE